MVAAVAVAEDVADLSAMLRPVYCPDCGRYIGAAELPAGVPVAGFRLRLDCRNCGRWDWYDAATGVRRRCDLTERRS
jgi:hypothetical protein